MKIGGSVDVRKLADELHARCDQMVADLGALVSTESPSRSVGELEACAQVMADLFKRETGVAATMVEPAPVGEPRGKHFTWCGGVAPKVLILGHYDTVFPSGTIASRPFKLENGVATGPGVFDMKAAIVQALHAIAVLPAEVRAQVEVLFTSDEEIGSASSREYLVTRAKQCGHVLVLEPSADGGALKTARKGTGTFEILFHGRSAHAGLEPEKGINALMEMANQIPRIASFADPSVGTTVTPTVASAGSADNSVPAEARLFVDVRVEAPGEKERLEGLFGALTPTIEGCRIELRGGIGRPPMPVGSAGALMKIASGCYEALGYGKIDGIPVGGGSDGNFTAAAGVPTLDGLGAVGGAAHGDTEYVVVSEMPKRSALLAAIIATVVN